MPESESSLPKVSGRSKRRRWLFRLIAVGCGLLLASGVAEIAVRMIGVTDADGNFWFRERPVGGIRPQVEWVRKKIAEYKANPRSRMMADRRTGWSPRPGVTTHDGMYRYNAEGIRTPTNHTAYSAEPAQGVLRIAIFGDSFAHCDDVPFEQSWGDHLQRLLNEAGVKAEVINFGVSAYGMDQAFLRWRELGSRYKPHIVLFGFQGENVARNVNLLRGFYMVNTGIPFSKPRFIIAGERLKAINLPTLPVDSVPDVMADMEHWEFAKYEWFYNPRDYERRFWEHCRFLALVVDELTDRTEPGISRAAPLFSPDGEPAQVTRQILREFRDDVQQQGGRFYVVHLPKRGDLQRLNSDRGLKYGQLWQHIAAEHAVIDPLDALWEASEDSSFKSLFAAKKYAHYSDKGNRLLAAVIAERLKNRKN